MFRNHAELSRLRSLGGDATGAKNRKPIYVERNEAMRTMCMIYFDFPTTGAGSLLPCISSGMADFSTESTGEIPAAAGLGVITSLIFTSTS
jgi:hypothetical protein